jgi:lipopolysaccharide biosynthesis glycosyltransferase
LAAIAGASSAVQPGLHTRIDPRAAVAPSHSSPKRATARTLTEYRSRALVSSSDEKYCPGLLALIASALTHLPAGFEVDVVVFDEGLSERSRRELSAIVSGSQTSSTLHLEPGFSRLGRDLPLARHVTLATYSRLLIPALSPVLERAVYIDADMLAVDDISELFTMDMCGKVFAGCIDKDTPTAATGVPYAYGELQIPADQPYFNAGLIVIDVPAWRDAKVGDATEDFVCRWAGDLRCPDQEGINAVCGHRALVLDRRYNFQVSGESLAAAASGRSAEALADLRRAAIIHYTGPKPWLNVWFSSTVWARSAAPWWRAVLRAPLLPLSARARIARLAGRTVLRELLRRIVRSYRT